MENHCGISIITAELRESLTNRSKIIAEWRKSIGAGGESLVSVGEEMKLRGSELGKIREGMLAGGKRM